jgi:peptidoglycan/xylan/chitin deacetylase (PgdA/CDA1 family)
VTATLVVSLDFELYWGLRDIVPLERYRANLLGVRQAVPAMLDLFREYEVHATWAAVGALLTEGREDLRRSLPTALPAYQAPQLRPFDALDALGDSEADDPFHFGPSLARAIVETPNQELGTHTFSHYYCLEAGQTEAQFRADLKASQAVTRRFGASATSLVFPRNQDSHAYLEACRGAGITAYRGTPSARAYQARSEASETLARRGLRLADAYLNLTGHHLFSSPVGAAPFDIPASRFLRPFSPKLAAAEPLRLRRIIGDLDAAAQRGQGYHLWWHPHNFGAHLNENLRFLRGVLEHFSRLRARSEMRSRNMGELAREWAGGGHP